jgi:phosphoribosyl 1,2-cyclic phosphate phosphodiesterase
VPAPKAPHDGDADDPRLRLFAGVPRPALGWGACDPNNPKNRRRRCSLLVERTGAHGTTRIVIDTSPDLREQLIDAEVDHIDAVFLTHEHADQTHGIDDLRSVVLHQRRRIPVYFNQSTAKDIMARFSYCFIAPEGSDYPPILTRHSIEAGEATRPKGRAVRSNCPLSWSSTADSRRSASASADAAYTP